MGNIFEFIGLKSDHRSKDNVTMKVKHFDEVPDSKKPRRATYYAQIKKDGIFCHVVKSGDKFGLFSRTGMELQNTDKSIRRLKCWGENMPDGVYMTELCCRDCSLEALSGVFNPNRVKPLSVDQEQINLNSFVFFHDYISLDDFSIGLSTFDYATRYQYLKANLPMEFILLDCFLLHIDDLKDMAKYHIENGEEGIVIKRACEKWEAGHKGYKSMKIVRDITYDLLCTGYEEGTGKYSGKVANLIFRWKEGKEIKAMLGKGWTHQDAELMFQDAVSDETFAHLNGLKLGPIGNIFQVYALQESSKGVLRLPKVGPARFDKEKADV